MAYRKNKVGETVVLQHQISCLLGTFEKGTTVKITGVSERGYDIEDEYGNKMTECGWRL